MPIFDFDGDGKTGFLDILFGAEAFKLYNEYCDTKEKLRESQEELNRLSGKYHDYEDEMEEFDEYEEDIDD